MATLDLDKRRALHPDEPKQVTVDGETFDLAPSISIETAALFSEGKIRQGCRELFDGRADEAMRVLRGDEINVIARELYGLTVGESSGSAET